MDEKLLLILFGVFLILLAILVLLAWFFVLARPWFRGLLGGGFVSVLAIVGMRLRGTPALLLIDAYLILIHRGVSTSIRTVESTYLAHEDRGMDASRLAQLVQDASATRR